LHNALILAILESGSSAAPSTSNLEGGSKLIRKRKRLLPYQGPDAPEEGEGSLRSKRFKRWAVEMKSSERESIKQLRSTTVPKVGKDDGSKKEKKRDRPLKGRDQSLNERGVILVREGKGKCGTLLHE
jgi:hypothetical protein